MAVKRCMIVDDSSVIRKVAKRILSGQDMLVVEAETGAQALDNCAHEMPDVLIVDRALPDMALSDFIRRLRALPHGQIPRISVCLMEFDIASIMRAKRAGADGYVMKPFDRAQLMRAIGRLSKPATTNAAA